MEEVFMAPEIQNRCAALYHELSIELKLFPVEVTAAMPSVIVKAPTGEVAQAEVLEEAYLISTPFMVWKEKTTYLCDQEDDHCSYYVDTMEECLGEMKRLVIWAAQQTEQKSEPVLIPQPIIKDYGHDVPAFRLNVDDWLDEKIKEGRIAFKINNRGDMRQRAITPGLYKIMKDLGVSDKNMLRDRVVFYEAEIRTENGKGTAIFRMAARQRHDTDSVVREYYKKILIPGFGKGYRADCEWYRLPLMSRALHENMTGRDIYDLLEAGLIKGEKFEKSLLK